MFNIDLQDLGGTLGMGVSAILLLLYLEYLLRLLRGDNSIKSISFPKWLKSIQLKFSNIAIVFTAIFIFVIGTLVEEITDYWTDSESYISMGIIGLNKETDNRKKSLVKNDNNLTSLGKEVFRMHGLLNSAVNRNTDSLSTNNISLCWEIDGSILCKDTDLESYVNSVYYKSKNWCYSISNYFVELQQIQNRIDFTRGIYFIIKFGLLLSILYLLISVLKNILIKKRTSQLVIPNSKQISFNIIILFILLIFSKQGYNSSELNFNNRAFGYYISYWEEQIQIRNFSDNEQSSVLLEQLKSLNTSE